MNNLKRFFRNLLNEDICSVGGGELERLPKMEIESHMIVSDYGNFSLTNAVRPSFDLRIQPEEGFRLDRYVDEQSRVSIPVLMASVSRERLFDTFVSLLEPLGMVVDVVLETSHRRRGGNHADLYREQIDLPILKSYLYDFEDLLLNDGCTGIAVLNPSIPIEIQFDEHKMLIVYAENVRPFEKIFREHGVRRRDRMRFLTEAEHVHTTRDEYYQCFQQFQTTLGIDEGCPASF